MSRKVRIKSGAGEIFVDYFFKNYGSDNQSAMLASQKAHWLNDNAGRTVDLILLTVLDNNAIIKIDEEEKVVPYYCLEEIT